MIVLAESLVASGGPSAPVWAFLTGISLATLTIIGQQLKAKSDLKRVRIELEMAKSEATKAHQSATQAETNTANLSNGFANSVLGKLERIHEAQQDSERTLREHLRWHLDRTE